MSGPQPPTRYNVGLVQMSMSADPDRNLSRAVAKVEEAAAAGAQLVWVIDPERRAARVYRADGTESLLSESDALKGEGVLPGFSCAVRSILPLN